MLLRGHNGSFVSAEVGKVALLLSHVTDMLVCAHLWPSQQADSPAAPHDSRGENVLAAKGGEGLDLPMASSKGPFFQCLVIPSR